MTQTEFLSNLERDLQITSDTTFLIKYMSEKIQKAKGDTSVQEHIIEVIHRLYVMYKDQQNDLEIAKQRTLDLERAYLILHQENEELKLENRISEYGNI